MSLRGYAVLLGAILGALCVVPRATAQIPNPDTSPHSERFIVSNGIRLHSLDWGGRGPTLLLLVGFGNTAHTYDRLAVQFTDRFRVISFTRRGIEPSDVPKTGYDLATLTNDIRAVMDAYGVDKAHLVGHSLAGTEMIEFGRRFPKRVMSMVFIEAANDPASVWAVFQRSPLGPVKVQTTPEIDRWWTTQPTNFTTIHVPALAMYAVEDRFPFTPDGATAEMKRRMDEYWRNDYEPVVQRTAEKFRRDVPHGSVVMMNGPHYLYRANEAQVVAEMNRFYASIPK